MQACAILVLALCHALPDICAAANNTTALTNVTTTTTMSTTNNMTVNTTTSNTTTSTTTATATTTVTTAMTATTSNASSAMNATATTSTTSRAINATEGLGMIMIKAKATNTTTNTTVTTSTSTQTTTSFEDNKSNSTTRNGTVFMTYTTTSQLVVHFSGTMSIKATGLTRAQVEMSAMKALAQEFLVDESQVTVMATESRRLRESAATRRLAGNWAVAFTIETVSSKVAQIESAAKLLSFDIFVVAFQNKMKKALTDVGVDANSLFVCGCPAAGSKPEEWSSFNMYLVVAPTTTVCVNCTVTTTRNGSEPNMTLLDVVDPPANLTNDTFIQLDIDPNATFTSTTFTTTSGTSIEFLGFVGGNTTTTLYQWTTVTTTSTTTTGKPCRVPFDPWGVYVEQPWSYGDNTSWRLYCNDSYITSNGLTLASCIGNGVLRPAGRCRKSGCKQAMVPWDRRFHTCPPHLGEGESCSVICDPKSHEKSVGEFTCIRGEFRGMPSCLDSEAKYYQLFWVLPKISASFNFAGEFPRWVNMSNDTISGFQTDVLLAFAGTLLSVDPNPTYFKVFEVHHLWQSSNVYHVDTGEILNSLRSHLFSVNYEFIVWDVNTLRANEEAVRAILRAKSTPWQFFVDKMKASANLTLLELYPTTWPMAYNETVLASDVEESPSSSLATSCWIDARLIILLFSVSNFLPQRLAGEEHG